jgi:hypothetical protein
VVDVAECEAVGERGGGGGGGRRGGGGVVVGEVEQALRARGAAVRVGMRSPNPMERLGWSKVPA